MKRRDFLKLSAITALSLAFSNRLLAADDDESSDYKALVVLYHAGGNDSLNMFIPSSDDEKTGYPPYSRGRENLKVNNEELTLPLDDNGDLDLTVGNPYNVDSNLETAYTKGFYKHKDLDLATNGIMPELAHLIDKGKVAIVANTGNLIEPATKKEFEDGVKEEPPFLFAHNHQTTLIFNGLAGEIQYTGWAGRIYDAWKNLNGDTLYNMNIAINSNAHLFYGEETEPLVINSSGPSRYATYTKRGIYDDLLNLQGNNIFENLHINKQKHSFDMQDTLWDDWNNNAPVWVSKTAYKEELFRYPDSSVIQQNLDVVADSVTTKSLEAVAKWAYIGKSNGLKRQIFYVLDYGYDTHGNQTEQHSRKLRGLSMGLESFYKALEDMGMENDVTLFSVSDFGRSLGDNGDGTDHAWGASYFVMGGAVKGGLYGKLPDLNLGSDDDIDYKGRLIPTTSMSQYYATIFKWFGIDDELMDTILPELKNFEVKDLGFMG